MDRNSLVETSVKRIKSIIIFLYTWLTTDGEALGYILGHIHFMLFMFLLTSILVAHTIYPSFWLQLTLFIVISAIWSQHIFLRVCVSIVAEKEFTNSVAPFHELLETVFGISTNDFINYFIVAETVALGCFGLEITSRIFMYIYDW